MLFIKIPHRFWMILIICFFWASASYATCTGIACTCTIASTPLSFGNYIPINNTAVTSTGTVSVTCSVLVVGLTVSYNISLNAGSSASFNNRTMKLNTKTLNYNLYTNSNNTLIWGDGTGSTNIVSDSYFLVLLFETRPYTVYGKIPAGQTTVTPGVNYTDSITATVTF